MNLFRLADLISVKHGLQSRASSIENIVDQVKRDLINAYNLYVNSQRTKDPVLQMLADAGEPFSKSLVKNMEEIIGNIDSLTLVQLFNRVNKILESIKELKSDPDKKVRQSIHDLVRVNKESERNYREHVKSKFEMVVSRLSSILEKQALILRKFLPKETALEGGAVETQRKELSKEKLLMFMRTPGAQTYGLDNIDVMTKLLTYPEIRQKITTLVNAIDRGHVPADGPEVANESAQIMQMFKDKQSNESLFEAGEDEAKEQMGATVESPNDPDATKTASSKLLKKYNNLSFEQWMKETK